MVCIFPSFVPEMAAANPFVLLGCEDGENLPNPFALLGCEDGEDLPKVIHRVTSVHGNQIDKDLRNPFAGLGCEDGENLPKVIHRVKSVHDTFKHINNKCDKNKFEKKQKLKKERSEWNIMDENYEFGNNNKTSVSNLKAKPKAAAPGQQNHGGRRKCRCWTNNNVCRVRVVRQNINWSPPPRGVWKINVDGSAPINKPGTAGVGGVIRDFEGKVLLIFSKNIGVADSYLAELMAVAEALSIVANANFNSIPEIIIESDCKTVVSWLNKVLHSPLKYCNLLDKMQNLYSGLGKISFVHAFREANYFADSLAKMGAHRNSDLVIWS